MDIEQQPIEQQLLRHAERQTTALEALRNFALILLALMAVGFVVWLFVVFA